MTTVLATTGLSVHFGGVRAVDEVDIVVEEGQLVGLIGPNGAGKTTLNWFLLFGGLVLILTLIQNPEGVAGSFYRTSQARAKRKAELAAAESAEAA